MKTKKLIRLTESDLHNIIKESVNSIINEIFDGDYDGFFRANAKGLADFGSRSLRAQIDPNYRMRKQRQSKLFSKELGKMPTGNDTIMRDRMDGYEKGAVGINRMKLRPNRDLGYDADKEGESYDDYLDRNGY